MHYSYTGPAGTETHHAYDFDVSRDLLAVDFIYRFRLLLQNVRTTFVAASLLINQRDVLANVTRESMLPLDAEDLLPLIFLSGPGLNLQCAHRMLFTVRIVTCAEPHDEFLLTAICANYTDEQLARRVQTIPTLEKIQWVGAPRDDTVQVHDGKMYASSIFPWLPTRRGHVAYVVVGDEKEEYDPFAAITLASSIVAPELLYDPALPPI